MNAIRFTYCCLLSIALAGLMQARSVALPVFANPAGTHPAGIVLLPNVGPVPLPPAGIVGPIPFFDPVPNILDPHHWEIELNNTGAGPLASDVVIAVPGGGIAFLGNVTLLAGGSVYWDIHYPDVPEVGGPYFFFATNAPGGVPAWTIDSSVVEHNFPMVGPGPAGPVFGGAGGLIGPLLGGPLLAINLIPEPGTVGMAVMAMCAAGMSSAVRQRRRNHLE